MRLQAMAVLAVLVAGLAMTGHARAQTTVRVLETWPAGTEVTLGRNQNFHLRLAYSTDKPVHIWARPYFHGKPVDAGSNPSPEYSGSGEAVGWVFFMQPGDEVDEIRIEASDGGVGAEPVLVSWRGHIVGGTATATAAEPDWVGQLRASAQAAQDRADQTRRNQPSSVGDALLFTGFMLVMPMLGLLAFAAPAWGLWRWRGGWRVAAAVPAVLMGFVLLRIVAGTMIDPTSHNLWPFEILQVGALSVVIMGALLLARKLSGARGS